MTEKKYLDYDGLADVACKINEVDAVANAGVATAVQANERLDNQTASSIPYQNATSCMVADDVQEAIDELKGSIDQIPRGIVPRGTVAFASLPSLASAEIGDMYNISDDFTTTSDFVVPGVNEKAGSNVYVADMGSNVKKWDVFAVAPDIVVDQIYNPTSTNPQSGVAVAGLESTLKQAICCKADCCNAKFVGSISMGRCATSLVGGNSVATGEYVIAEGTNSHAEGTSTCARGNAAHAEGNNTVAGCASAHAEGSFSCTFAPSSHAEGAHTRTYGDSSHAEGYANVTCPIACYSHAEGVWNTAIGVASHVEGLCNTAKLNYSHVVGKYATNDCTYVEKVGWGECDSCRKNIRALDTLGNEYLQGDVFLCGNTTCGVNARLSGITTCLSCKADTSSLCPVATSGEYCDLQNVPTVDSAMCSTSTNAVMNCAVDAAVSCKVDKVLGKGLSTNDFTNGYKTKLDGIESGAQVNVQSDWNQSDSTKDDFVKNKPSINGKILISDGTGRSYSLVDREELPSNITLDDTQFTSWHFQNVFTFKNKLCAIYNSNHLVVFSDGEWTNPTIPSEINSLYCPTVFNNHLCFGTEDGLYVTEDLVTFTLVESVTTSISKLAVFNNKLYATGYNTPIYVTEDLTTFTTLDFTASGINDMTSTSTTLYVAVQSDFVYTSTDGTTFTHLTKPETLPTNNVALMEPDEDASVMYIGTLSNGLYISNLDLTTAEATEIGAPYAVQCVGKYKGQVFVGTENGIYVQDKDDVFKLFDSSDTVSLQEYDDELYAATFEDGLKSFKTEHELQYLKPSDVQSTSVPTQGSDTFISSNGVYVALSSLSSSVDTKLATKVDKEEGKGLSTNDFTNDYKTKLDGIESGAQVNVQSDWNAVSGDAYIDNKPQINSVALTGNNNGKYYGLVDEADLPVGPAASRESIQLDSVPNLVRGKVFNDKLYLINTLESFINYTEDGTSWQTSTIEGASLMTSIEIIGSTLCIGADEGLFISSDGQNFTLVENSPSVVRALYVIPGNTPILLISTADGLYSTSDLTTFTKISSLTSILSMASDSSYVYYGTNGDFIYYAPINQIGSLTKWNTSEVSEFATKDVYTISSVEDGVIRFGMDGLYTGSVVDNYITKVGLDDCFVISTLEMNDNLFVGADRGLFIQSDGGFTQLETVDGVYSLTEFEGKLYATSLRNGVYVYVLTTPSHNLRYLKPSQVEHTTVPTEGSDTFISSGDVKTAIDSALSSVYKAQGSKTVEEMIPLLLVETNLGNVYNMSNSGTTTQYFVEGAGHDIKVGDNIVIIKDTDGIIKFDLLSGLVDMSNYVQKSTTTGLLKNDGSVDTNVYTTCTGTLTGGTVNDRTVTVSNGLFTATAVCAYVCRATLSDRVVALMNEDTTLTYSPLFVDSTNNLKYSPLAQKLTVGSRFCVCDSSVSGRSDFSFSGSQVAFYTPTCSGNGICMDMYDGKVTAKCFDGNATCFAGCTFACACAKIRSGLTSCTGTVTISNSTCGSAIPVALCTGSTTVGRSTCCSLTYVPTSGTLKVNGTDISHNSICAYNTNFTLSTAGTAGSLTIIPNYGVCLVPIIPTSTPTCLCNGMIWIS